MNKTTTINPSLITDKEVFNIVFTELRREGFIARQRVACCQSCAWALIENQYEDAEKRDVAFYHSQDFESFGRNGKLERSIYIGFQGNGKAIVEAFERNGFETNWDGSKESRIEVLHD